MTKEEARKLISILNIKEESRFLRYEFHEVSQLLEWENKEQGEIFQRKLEEHIKRLEDLEDLLLCEIKYDELKKHRKLNVQKSFETYITTVLKPGYSKSNYYGTEDGLFTFTNGASLFQLIEPLIVSEFITNKQRRGSRWEHRSKLDKEGKLRQLLHKLDQKMSNNELFEVEAKEEDVDKKQVVLISGTNKIRFNIYQFSYMDKFLGKDISLQVSPDGLAFGESEKGKGYILGLKHQ